MDTGVYAVSRGKEGDKTYKTWDEARPNCHRVSGALCKWFGCEEEAQNWLDSRRIVINGNRPDSNTPLYPTGTNYAAYYVMGTGASTTDQNQTDGGCAILLGRQLANSSTVFKARFSEKVEADVYEFLALAYGIINGKYQEISTVFSRSAVAIAAIKGIKAGADFRNCITDCASPTVQSAVMNLKACRFRQQLALWREEWGRIENFVQNK